MLRHCDVITLNVITSLCYDVIILGHHHVMLSLHFDIMMLLCGYGYLTLYHYLMMLLPYITT